MGTRPTWRAFTCALGLSLAGCLLAVSTGGPRGGGADGGDEISHESEANDATNEARGVEAAADAPVTVVRDGAPVGQSCVDDGDCNPGRDGSGLICSQSVCIPGCHAQDQCPGT